MERSEDGGSSAQSPLWRQLQARAKPLLSPRPGAREPGERRERGGMWGFRRRRRREPSALDRVLSSSQPDLLFSAPRDAEAEEAGKEAAAAGSRGCGAPVPARDQQRTSGRLGTSSPDKPTVAALLQSHHKSSSLGSACLERLLEPPGASGWSSGSSAQKHAGSLCYATRLFLITMRLLGGWHDGNVEPEMKKRQ
uniref:Uncharacterized protein n=1 Tax=Salarias fasciatus TaxID=181472 RepID=A0A672I7E4_SALFA